MSTEKKKYIFVAKKMRAAEDRNWGFSFGGAEF